MRSLFFLSLLLVMTLFSLRCVAFSSLVRPPIARPLVLRAAASTATPGLSADRFFTLLRELQALVASPDMAAAGAVRSIQVASGLASLGAAYARDPQVFMKDGQFSLPRALRRLCEELGATYIKLGQFIASSPTLFPAEFVEEFQTCLDRTPTLAYARIRAVIEAELRRPLTAVFASVDPMPLASASIAQVHRARLRDGTEVVIKVRKPGVETTLKADLAFLLVATKILEFLNPSLSSFSLANIITDLRASMLDELDFRKEARNLQNFRSFLETMNVRDAVAPKPFLFASGERILTMEFLDGVPLVDLNGLKGFTAQPEATLFSALRTWALTVANNDLFHADLHAGNLLVLRDGRVGFIDFGIVGKISTTFRNAIGDLFTCFVANDFEGVAKALVQMGATRDGVNIPAFAAELRAVVEQITQLEPQLVVTTGMDGVAVDAQLAMDERETTRVVLQIVGIAEKNGLKLPREFGLVLKQALYFDRYQKLLAPEADPLRDPRVRSQLSEQLLRINGGSDAPRRIIDVDAVET